MAKVITRGIISVLIFFIALVGMSAMTGREQTNLMDEMMEATLPIIQLKKEDVTVNQLYGYKGTMDLMNMRDTITPISEDLMLPVKILTYNNHIEDIFYEIRTLDTKRLVQQTHVSEYHETEGTIETSFQIENILEPDTEYWLIITLSIGEEELHFYTRIILEGNYYVDEALGFVTTFHENTFDKEKVKENATYMEPNRNGDNSTLHKVTIHSSMKQLGWADFEGEVIKHPVPSIKEINSTYTVIILDYVLGAKGVNGETEFYNVTEYYRVRYSSSNKRIYLLDFERTMNKIFRGDGELRNGTASLLLGIRDTAVNYKSSTDSSVIGFVQEGDLWCYNGNTNQLSLVFGFRGTEGMDDRENHLEYDIQIIKMDDSGTMDFVVYGYMNRGNHEGHTGVALCHYDSLANTVSETLFIQSDDSYQVLKENWGKLFYVSEPGYFYLIADAGLYRIHPTEEEMKLIRMGMKDGSYSVSTNGRYVATKKEINNVLIITDLETEKQWQITGEMGDYLEPIGFVQEDLVYGIGTTGDKEGLFHKVVIVNQNQEVLKEYQRDGFYVSNAYVKDNIVYLERVRETEEGFVPVDNDTIKSQELEKARNIWIEIMVTEKMQTQVKITASKKFTPGTVQILTPKEVVAEQKFVLTPELTQGRGYYYVYRAGEIILCTMDLKEAVSCADAYAGTVLKNNVELIYRRGMEQPLY